MKNNLKIRYCKAGTDKKTLFSMSERFPAQQITSHPDREIRMERPRHPSARQVGHDGSDDRFWDDDRAELIAAVLRQIVDS